MFWSRVEHIATSDKAGLVTGYKREEGAQHLSEPTGQHPPGTPAAASNSASAPSSKKHFVLGQAGAGHLE
jgi:hypothetical protein